MLFRSVYGLRPTPLVGSTLGREQIVIDGRDVLLTQVLRQFRMMTGEDMSPIIALETLGRTTAVAAVKPVEAAVPQATLVSTADAN